MEKRRLYTSVWQFYGIQKRRRWASNGDIQSVDAGLQFTVDGALNSGDLAPNGKKEADLYFQVPKDDAELTLHYESSIWPDKTINIISQCGLIIGEERKIIARGCGRGHCAVAG